MIGLLSLFHPFSTIFLLGRGRRDGRREGEVCAGPAEGEGLEGRGQVQDLQGGPLDHQLPLQGG